MAPVIEEVSIEGMHSLDGQIYKVQVAVHGSGREYAKVLVTEQTGTCGGCEKCDGGDRCQLYASSCQYAAGMRRRPSDAKRPKFHPKSVGEGTSVYGEEEIGGGGI